MTTRIHSLVGGCGLGGAWLIALGGFLLVGPLVARAEWRLPIRAVSSFESGKVLASAELEFEREIQIERMRFEGPEGTDEPFYFVPDPAPTRSGRLFWMWRELPHFHTLDYVLHLAEGEWSGAPFGDEDIGERVRAEKYLLPNHAFEELDPEGAPVGWTLSGTAELAQDRAYRGSHSVRIVSTEEGAGRIAAAELVPFEPGKIYRISCRVKIVEREDTGNTHSQSVEMDLRTLDGSRRRLGRLMRRLNTAQLEEKDYLGKWVEITGTVRAPEEARYGQAVIYTRGLRGTYYVDTIILDESPRGQPVRIELGAP